MNSQFKATIKFLNRIKISPTARSIYLELACECTADGELVYVDVPALSEGLKRGVASIKKGVKELMSLDLFGATGKEVQRRCKLFTVKFKTIAMKEEPMQKIETAPAVAAPAPIQTPTANPSPNPCATEQQKEVDNSKQETKVEEKKIDPVKTKDLISMSDDEVLVAAAQSERAIKFDIAADYTAAQVEFVTRAENLVNLMISLGIGANLGRKLITHHGFPRCIELVKCYAGDYEHEPERFVTIWQRERYFMEKAEILETLERYAAERKEKASKDSHI